MGGELTQLILQIPGRCRSEPTTCLKFFVNYEPHGEPQTRHDQPDTKTLSSANTAHNRLQYLLQPKNNWSATYGQRTHKTHQDHSCFILEIRYLIFTRYLMLRDYHGRRMLLLIVLVLDFESRRGEIWSYFPPKKEGWTNCWECLAWVGAIRRGLTREESAEVFPR